MPGKNILISSISCFEGPVKIFIRYLQVRKQTYKQANKENRHNRELTAK